MGGLWRSLVCAECCTRPEHAGVRSSMVYLQSSRDRVGMVTQEQEDHDRQDEPCRVDVWELQAATAWPQR